MRTEATVTCLSGASTGCYRAVLTHVWTLLAQRHCAYPAGSTSLYIDWWWVLAMAHDGDRLTLYSAIPYSHSTHCVLDVGVSSTGQQETNHLILATFSSKHQTSGRLSLWLYRRDVQKYTVTLRSLIPIGSSLSTHGMTLDHHFWKHCRQPCKCPLHCYMSS